MNSILFTVVPLFIGVCAVFVFIGVISSFLGHRKLMNRMTDQVFRDATRDRSAGSVPDSAATLTPGQFSCSQCGAALGAETEISPSGDFKCPYCSSWSNVNR